MDSWKRFNERGDFAHAILAFDIALWVYLLLPIGVSTPICAFVLAALVLGYGFVNTNERAVKRAFGNPYATCESGLRWRIPLPGCELWRYTTNEVELELQSAGIFTLPGKAKGDKKKHGPITMGVETSFYFEWPEGDDLIKSAKILPSPENHEALLDIFDEAVRDKVRNVGGKEVWTDITRDREKFSRDILVGLLAPNSAIGILINKSGIRNHRLAIKHLDIPADVLTALTAEERALLEREGDIIKADTEKKTTVIKGQGIAEAKRILLAEIGRSPENLHAQALLTLIEMAQGEATSIFPIPTDLLNVLGGVLGRSSNNTDVESLWNAFTPAQKARLIDLVRAQLSPQGGSV